MRLAMVAVLRPVDLRLLLAGNYVGPAEWKVALL
jgi:hypothetical protein